MQGRKHTLLPYGSYVMIWFGLLALTALTVTATALQLGGFSVYTAILIALVKATLVAFYFMNLKKEPPVFKWMLLLALVTLAVIMVLTFFDISYR
jgi:cytochrome c oxidase subunit 4